MDTTNSAADRVPLASVRDLLRISHPLPFRVLDAQHRLLLNAGQVLLDEAQFETLVERGAWAERTLVEAARAARATAQRPTSGAPPASLFDRWERLVWQFDKLARALVKGAAPGSAVAPFFASLEELIGRDPDVALFLCVRQDDRRFALYPLIHSIHCAVVTVLTGRQLGWPEAQLTSMGCAALTMNLSMLDLQALLAEQDTPATTKQRERIRAHPEASVTLLRAAGVDDPAWLTAVLQHHERPDGGGYPAGLTVVDESAQVLRAADVYMARISPRAKRPAVPPQTAARQLFQQRPGDPLAMAMIKVLGVHPPGSLLQLRSGEVAVAIRRTVSGTAPVVATLSDVGGLPSLQTHRRDTTQPEFAVQGPLLDTKAYPRVLPERVYGFVAG